MYTLVFRRDGKFCVFLRNAAMLKLFTVVVLLACKATLNTFEINGFVMLKCVMLIAVAKRMLHKR